MSFLRVYEYPQRRQYRFKVIGFKGRRSSGARDAKQKLDYLFKLDNSLSRSRRTIQDFVLCNKFDYFCTFTFTDAKIDRTDYNACKKAITVFFKNFKQRYASDFRYLIVPERHKDGAWHFHGVISGLPAAEFTVPETIHYRNRFTNELELIPNRKGYVRWERYSKRFGFFDCSLIHHYEACASYVSKYITKDLVDFRKGSRIFFASQELNLPSLIMDEDEIPFPIDIKPTYEDQFIRMSWATLGQTIHTQLVDFFEGSQYEEYQAHWSTWKKDMFKLSRGRLETKIFEPLTVEQLVFDGYPQNERLKKAQQNAKLIAQTNNTAGR